MTVCTILIQPAFQRTTAFTVTQVVVNATSQSNGKGQILTPWGSETTERILMKLEIYNWSAGLTTHANPAAVPRCISLCTLCCTVLRQDHLMQWT